MLHTALGRFARDGRSRHVAGPEATDARRARPRAVARRLASGLALLAAASLMPAALRAQPPAVPADTAYTNAMNRAYDALRRGDTAVALDAFVQATQRDPANATPHLELAYVLLAQGRRSEAARRFEEGLARDHLRDGPRRQLGYLYADLGRRDAALQLFTWLRESGRAIPRDHVALGVLLAERARWADAEAAYRDGARLAAAAGDTALAREADAGARAVAALGASRAGLFAELYVAPFYQERFDNTIGLGYLRGGVRGGSWWRPSVYASLRATRDSRSTGGRQPVLFNDNTAIPAVGVRVQPGGGPVALYAEAGAAYDLVARPERAWHRDLRAGANLTWQREDRLTALARGLRVVSEVNGDASWYERFDRNVIAYGQLRESLRWRPAGGAFAVDLFARGWAATDSRGDFFNRVAEGGGGIALHLPVGGTRVSVYADVLRGRYLEPVPASAGLPRTYDDWRLTVATGFLRFRPFARP